MLATLANVGATLAIVEANVHFEGGGHCPIGGATFDRWGNFSRGPMLGPMLVPMFVL